ncbi:MAG TPA: hypothetical protein VES36_06675, partial [Candidatus Limnocylindrales bacterium]|nr:hypothetical protein [Candidatus Limnocylindrales bacterium]
LIVAHEAGDRDGATAGLADAIERLAGDGQRRAGMAAAAAEGSGRFDVGRRIGEVAELYRELLPPAA